ncbi:MAG: hypothetical protein WC477_00400 [Patescibacteria group bacterium]
MKSTLLLFDPQSHFVAEFSMLKGMCGCAYHPGTCLPVGRECEIESTFHEWHANGIPHSIHSDSGHTSLFGAERIPMSDPRCGLALSSWAVEHGYTIVSIPSSSFPVWELALRAPLKDDDLPRIARLISTASHSRLERIADLLKRAVVEAEASRPLGN